MLCPGSVNRPARSIDAPECYRQSVGGILSVSGEQTVNTPVGGVAQVIRQTLIYMRLIDLGAHGQGRILTVVCHRNGFGFEVIAETVGVFPPFKRTRIVFKDGFVEVREFFVDEGSPVGDI